MLPILHIITPAQRHCHLQSLGCAQFTHSLLMYINRTKKVVRDDDSELQEEDNLMTDQQKEEEAMFKHTFAFYQT